MPRRGSLHHKAKLTENQVREIRAKYATGKTSHWKLAMEYDLDSARTIACIVQRKTWTHI